MKLNHLADWFDYEYEQILGLNYHHQSNDDKIPTIVDDGSTRPVNWTDQGVVTAVKDRTKWNNQKGCASAYAVATAEVLESMVAIKELSLKPLSV